MIQGGFSIRLEFHFCVLGILPNIFRVSSRFYQCISQYAQNISAVLFFVIFIKE